MSGDGRRRDDSRGLDDGCPGPHEAPHGVLVWERAEILDLFDEWGGP